MVVTCQVTRLVKHKFDRWPFQNYLYRSSWTYRVSVTASGVSFVESKHVSQSWEWKLEWFECRRGHSNYYYMLLISYSCHLCMVAEGEITVCCSWKDFHSWKNSYNFLVILSSRCQFLLAQAIAWNETTDSYCLWVIPSNFLAILSSREVRALKNLCTY